MQLNVLCLFFLRKQCALLNPNDEDVHMSRKAFTYIFSKEMYNAATRALFVGSDKHGSAS